MHYNCNLQHDMFYLYRQTHNNTQCPVQSTRVCSILAYYCVVENAFEMRVLCCRYCVWWTKYLEQLQNTITHNHKWYWLIMLCSITYGASFFLYFNCLYCVCVLELLSTWYLLIYICARLSIFLTVSFLSRYLPVLYQLTLSPSLPQ